MLKDSASEPINELRAAIAAENAQAADLCLEELSPADSVRAVLRLSDDEQSNLLPNQQAANLLVVLSLATALLPWLT